MLTIDDVLFFDTETTGVPDRSAHWDTDYADYPHVVQLAWVVRGREETHIIRPDGWTIPEEAISVHGITNERALAEGEPFDAVVLRFLTDCIGVPLICGHNIHFDTSIIKANIIREYGWKWYDENGVEDALFKGKRIDTMRPAMKWVDARAMNGRLKFPRLEELYSRCFPGETFPAHDALEDVKACQRCLPVLLDKGIVELRIKEYPKDAELFKSGPSCEQVRDQVDNKSQETAKIGPNSADMQKDDNLHIQAEKCAKIEDSEKITDDDVAFLLGQNDF